MKSGYFIFIIQRITYSFLIKGETAYVMTEEGTSFRFWNASTGDSYEMQDVHSPLQSIGCLINHENVRT